MTKCLLVVDVQPAYSSVSNNIAPAIAELINDSLLPVICMWVGKRLTRDTEKSVKQYLINHGLQQARLADIQFIEKGFGFFRSWMDAGIATDIIVKVGRYMMTHKLPSSIDVDMRLMFGEQLPPISSWHDMRNPQWNEHGTRSFVDSKLAHFDSFITCGGGKSRCLAEMELWLEMKHKQFLRLNHLVY